MRIAYLPFVIILILSACGTTKEAIYTAPPIEVEERVMDTMFVTAAPPDLEVASLTRYNPAYTRTWDLLHTSLDLKFNWDSQQVLGEADLKLKPIFYAQDKIELHAQNFDLKEIRVAGKLIDPSKIEYNGQQLLISLDRRYKKAEEVSLSISYVANPENGTQGGSAAITSDKGLFFINPLGDQGDKPRQIWTQGETENNSRWFPTIDRPNERCTQKIKLTVKDKYVTLSNGTMTGSKPNGNGTRTDTWEQKDPHAPYLFMLAVGEFAVVEDRWKNIPVDYYVEEEYRADAKRIFNHTPEMLSFFSDKLDYPYPWEKYSQIVVRDFVSGAMENTTAVIFGDFVQKTTRELIDNDNDYIVAHEMMHHWFGDLVTCESWSNLTLNEGFANYAEYLWFEHKYGPYRADNHRADEMAGYLYSFANQGGHPLIHYGYSNKEDMFDAHSYNKGGMVLHALRGYLGDEAFFASLNKYLVDNKYSAVEVDELRMAFEDTTGEDLNWFFDQWYLSSGHPILEVDYSYNELDKVIKVSVNQVQNTEQHLGIYQLPLEVYIFDKKGNRTTVDYFLQSRSDTISINYEGDFAVALIDGPDNQLAEITEQHSTQEHKYIAQFSEELRHIINSFQTIAGESVGDDFYQQFLNHPYHLVRTLAISLIADPTPYQIELKAMATSDKHSETRSAALSSLSFLPADELVSLCEQILKKEQAYPVIASAIMMVNVSDADKGIALADQFSTEPDASIRGAVASVYVATGDPKYIDYFLQTFQTQDPYDLFQFTNQFKTFMSSQNDQNILKASDGLELIASSKENGGFRKFVAMFNISNLKGMVSENPEKYDQTTLEKIQKAIDNIKSKETDKELLQRYQGF